MDTVHTFHIPVMGLGFTIDTPIKVAKYGISSVVSIMEDQLIEQMRKFYSTKYNLKYTPISEKEEDFRANRITEYLNLLVDIVDLQMVELQRMKLSNNNDADKYFSLLYDTHPFKILYSKYINQPDQVKKYELELLLKKLLIPGSIDVNIMSKADRDSYDESGNPLNSYFSNASSSLRGYVKSKCKGGLVLSAGFNPRLYNYIAEFSEFKPSADGNCDKKIILKVSDFRSAQIQGKYFAKKGILVNEFRIESGLNCGGHAFPTDGQLMGPVLDDFKTNIYQLNEELIKICNTQLQLENKPVFKNHIIKVSAQGGVGTSEEHNMLIEQYNLYSVGWGSPFLLVPEATNLDNQTRELLEKASAEDYFLSNTSPLGVMINNLKTSTSLNQLNERIASGKPGSPCVKKYLAFNTEFTKEPICVASRQYQDLKIKELMNTITDSVLLSKKISEVIEKECLCEGLSVSALQVNQLENKKRPQGVSICPGPNIKYFSGTFSLKQMVDHIYGKINLLNDIDRPHVFINELGLYVDYARNEYSKLMEDFNQTKRKSLNTLLTNLNTSIEYYKKKFNFQLNEASEIINDLSLKLKEQVAINI